MLSLKGFTPIWEFSMTIYQTFEEDSAKSEQICPHELIKTVPTNRSNLFISKFVIIPLSKFQNFLEKRVPPLVFDRFVWTRGLESVLIENNWCVLCIPVYTCTDCSIDHITFCWAMLFVKAKQVLIKRYY